MPRIRPPGAPVAQPVKNPVEAPRPAAAPAAVKAPDAFAPTAAAAPAAGAALFHGSRDAYFAALDHDPTLRAKANGDAVGALLDLMTRPDVPESLEHAYTAKAGSVGGGRVLMVLDYTRGIPSDETTGEALKKGPLHFLAAKILTPMLTHFRNVDGESLFPGDATMTPAFRDSPLWGAKTNQVGHLLCAVETGARMGRFAHHGVERAVFELGLKAGGAIAGFHNIEGNVADWSRAGILGHEMIGDEDGSGFLGQMRAYDKLVANGDPDHIRQHWDQAVAAVLKGDHAEAFVHIDAISKAIEAPTTPAEVAANLKNDHPRFATPHASRDGDSREDVALSIYGFATGYAAMTRGFKTPADARKSFEDQFSATGASADAIDRAAHADR